MFAYSERPGTLAAKKIEDDIPTSTKKEDFKKSSTCKEFIVNTEPSNLSERQSVF
jgi:tRNA A37 methylthiotransferase MiaB